MNPRLAIPFYLGLGASAARGRYPDCSVRAAVGHEPELIRALLLTYRGEGGEARVVRINHRCAEITLPGRAGSDGRRFFFKEFPRQHALHDLERALRLSRVDRAWRAAHLLPRLGINTPAAVGTGAARGLDGRIIEYLATEWLEGARPFPDVVGEAKSAEERLTLLCEFARSLRLWHDQGVYLRDLVRNVLVVGARPSTRPAGKHAVPLPSGALGAGRTYWLTDLDGLHPAKRVTRERVLWHMRQLAHYVGPVAAGEPEHICLAYGGRPDPAVIAAVSRIS